MTTPLVSSSRAFSTRRTSLSSKISGNFSVGLAIMGCSTACADPAPPHGAAAPDTYQGAELWDFHLVDPDNRQPVDYGRRWEMLANLKQRMATDGDARCGLAGELVAAREDGRIKLYLTHQALRSRRQHPGLFHGRRL